MHTACRISRFKLSEGHRKRRLFFCGSTQWEAWVTKPQLFVLMPSQHASVSNGTHCPAAGHDISFLVSDGLLGLSFISTQWPIRPEAWYLLLAKRVKLAIILLSFYTSWWKRDYSSRFTAVWGKTKGILTRSVSPLCAMLYGAVNKVTKQLK